MTTTPRKTRPSSARAMRQALSMPKRPNGGGSGGGGGGVAAGGMNRRSVLSPEPAVEAAEGDVEPQHEPVVAARRTRGSEAAPWKRRPKLERPRLERTTIRAIAGVGGVADAGGGVMVTGNCHRSQCPAPSSPSCNPSMPDRHRPIPSAAEHSTSST